MKNKTIKAISAIIVSAMLLCACGSESDMSIEDEVAANLNAAASSQTVEAAEAETQDDTLIENDEVEAPDESIMTDSSLDTIEMETSEATGDGNVESTHAIEDDDVNTQIVIFGDSIFDSVRDETGIAYQLGENLNADIYNLAIGGTSAGMRMDKSTDLDSWTEPTLMGMIYAAEGKIDRSFLSYYKAGEIMNSCDFSQTDYFIIEYGTNDFLSYIPLGTQFYAGQYYFYFRSVLDIAVKELQANYPDAKIILCTPYYEEYWSADRTRYIGDCHTVNNGYGTLLEYISVLQDIGRDYQLPCLNMYNLLGISIYNVNDATVDGIHPSETTRKTYAELLTQAINDIEETGSTDLDFQAQERIAEEQAAQAAQDAAAAETAGISTDTQAADDSSDATQTGDGTLTQ